MLIEALQKVLAADSSMQTALGVPSQRGGNTGIFPLIAPDECKVPYVVLQQISGEPLQTSMQGTGRLQTSRWRFSCHGSTYKQAKIMARTLRVVLEALYGPITLTGATDPTVIIQGSWLRMEADDAEEIPHGTLYTTHVDFEMIYLDLD